ncbi:non-canonical purine NTP pyrophosphatase [Candidatus Gottesmanbacteria bacterium]|nr:non-canonical purine NTP pyrophosphatase [Candidatus Gottesmanbacteria bacterium]
MKHILIATTNPGKLKEIQKSLSNIPCEFLTLSDLRITQKSEESGATFEENARIKAQFYFQKSGLPTIADDGGLEIEALNMEPGVKSHRWIHGDREDGDEELIAYTLTRLKGVLLEKRQAQMHVVVLFQTVSGVTVAEEYVKGIIPLEASPLRTSGFPFRSLLFILEIGKYYDDTIMTKEENEKYGHRVKALRKLGPVILKAASQ